MFLDKIVKHKLQEVENNKRRAPLKELEGRLGQTPGGFPFRSALAESGMTLIAEIKKASPSKGLLCPDFNPRALAETYADNGAGAISVLTDEFFFEGSLKFLSEVKDACSLPILRKDFIIDPYQIIEAAVNQADAVLLIAAILDAYQLRDFLALAGEVGLDCLTEVHNHRELEKALTAEAPIIGVNNRDLTTFEVSLATSLEIVKEIPAARLKISESGIFTGEDVKRLLRVGFDGILVGEAIVKAPNRAAKLRELALL